VLAAQPDHLRADHVGGQHRGLAVDGVDLVSDGDVLISDGAARRTRVPRLPSANARPVQQARLLRVDRTASAAGLLSITGLLLLRLAVGELQPMTGHVRGQVTKSRRGRGSRGCSHRWRP
jgi:hypothetical protein